MLDRKPEQQNPQKLKALDDVEQLFAGIVLSPRNWFSQELRSNLHHVL